MIPTKIKKHAHILQVLMSCKNPKLRKSIIEQSGDGLTKVLCEVVKNSLLSDGCIKHTKKDIQKLKKHKKTFVKLIDRKVPIKRKKKILVQTGGGFLSALIKPLLSIFLPGLIKE